VRRVAATAAVLFATVELGTAVAAGGAVTIQAGSSVVPAGTSVELAGAVSPAASGEPVTLLGKECAVPGPFRALGAAVTTDGGAWRTFVQ
jgi:hypothetical protein